MKDLDPVRWLEADSDAPREARRLLKEARRVAPLSDAARARAAANAKTLSAGAPAPPQPFAIAGGIVVGAMALVLAGFLMVEIAARPAAAPAVAPVVAATPRLAATSANVNTLLAAQTPDIPTVDVGSLPISASASRPSAAAAANHDAPAEDRAVTPPPGEDTLAAETKLVEEARRDLATNPEHALAALDQHAASFPRGALAAEREFLAVRTLTRLGRKADANVRAARLIETYPGSPYAARVQNILGSTEVGSQ